jgi:hypothetical protein
MNLGLLEYDSGNTYRSDRFSIPVFTKFPEIQN